MNGLHHFCLLIQDWGNIASFSPDFRMQHFSSIATQTLDLCFDFKHNQLGSEPIGLEESTVKKNNMSPVLYEGSWNDPGSREQCLSVVSKFHDDHGQVRAII